MKIWTSIKLIILGLLLIGAGMLYESVSLFIAPEHLRQIILTEFARNVNAKLQVQRAGIDVQGNVQIEDVFLTAPGTEEPLFVCPRVEVGLRAGFLLKRKVVPDKVALFSPTIRLAFSPEQDSWNFQSITVQPPAAAPATPGRPAGRPARAPAERGPTGLLQQGITVENATLIVTYSRLFGDSEPRTYPGLYVHVTPDSAGVWHFEGSGVQGSLAGVRFSGWYIPGHPPQLNIRFSNDILPVDRAYWRTVPYGASVWEDFQPAGTMAVSGELNLDENGKLNYSIDAGMHDATGLPKYFPFPVHSVSGSVVVSNAGIVLKDITGIARAEDLGGGAGTNPVHVRISGSDSRENGNYLYSIQASDVPLSRKVIEAIPDAGREIWQRVRSESGTCQVALTLSRPRRSARTRFHAEVSIRSATVHPPELPMPLHQVDGTVTVSNDSVVLKDVTAVARPEDLGATGPAANPIHMRLSGSEGLDDGSYLYAIQASDLPLTKQAVEAIPQVGAEVWRRLGPSSGSCQLTLALSRPLRSAHGRLRAEVDIRSATLHPPEIPLPLRQVNGTIIVDDDAVQLQNLSGIMQQDLPEGPSTAYFRVQGLADIHKKESSLDVAFQNVHTTEELVKAIPHSGDVIWRTVQPLVALDGRLLVGNDAEGDLAVQSALLDVHGGDGQLDFWPLPLHNLNGTLKLTGTDLQIERLEASIRLGTAWDRNLPESSRLTAYGTVDLKANKADVHIDGQDMVVGEELLRSIPVVGAQIWDEARPVGVAGVSGQMLYDAAQDHPLRCFLDVNLQDVSMDLKLLKTPLDAVAGHVLVTERQAFSNDFSGLVCGGRFVGRAIVYYPPEEKYPRYSASGSFEKVDVTKLARRLTGKDQQIVGQIAGWVDMGGVYGQDASLAANGHLSLVDGHLLHIPLFAQLLTVLRLNLPEQEKADQEGQLDFSRSAGKVTVREFELIGAGLNISGYGTIGLDESLDMTMIAVGAPEKGSGFPVLSTLVDWLLKPIERQLVRVDVTGTLSKPQFSPQVLSTITWPLRSLRSLLFTPILGGSSPEPAK